jgi:hypothetical protein
MMTAVAAELEPEDLQILGMLMNRTPPVEIAQVLGVTTEWLEMRRWATLQRVTVRSSRRHTPPLGRRAGCAEPYLGTERS